MRFSGFVVCGCLCLVAVGGSLRATDGAEDLRVLPPREPQDRSPSLLYQRLQAWAEQALDRRTRDYEQLKTPDQISAWQRQRREIFLQAIGGLPARDQLPLNSQTVGRLVGDRFQVEKVIFESRPNHHITANLYLPTTKPPYPGVIVPCGHSYTGKGADGYQKVSMLLAQNGIAALCYDPIGQGERYQTMGPDGRPLGAEYLGGASSVKQLAEIPGAPHFNPVEEHTLIGLGAILAGTNTAQYRIHDGLRAVDYLVSRPEIDPQRIGCTGNSGGGTLTAYLMALDDRIACAAPTCYLTTFRRLLATSGPQDAEQNLFGQIRDGLDEADYVLMRAPKPTALCAGTRDATFDIAGTWDIFREAKRVYARLGSPEQVDLVEADEPHGFTQPLRVGATRWMRRWLLDVDDAVTEPELPVFPLRDLQCSPTGQVLQLPGEVSTFQLTARRADEFAAARRALWTNAPREEALGRVRELAGIRPLAEIPPAKARKVEGGTLARERYRIDKWRIQLDTGSELPALAFIPDKGTGRRALYLHRAGKAAESGLKGELEALAQAGVIVLAVDLSGLGETAARHPRDWGGTLFPTNTQEFFLAYLLGKSLVGIRAEEVWAATRVLRELDGPGDGKHAPVEVIAIGSDAGIPALHAVALSPADYSRLTLRGVLGSWRELLDQPTNGTELSNVVHAALTAYDLPDLRLPNAIIE